MSVEVGFDRSSSGSVRTNPRTVVCIWGGQLPALLISSFPVYYGVRVRHPFNYLVLGFKNLPPYRFTMITLFV